MIFPKQFLVSVMALAIGAGFAAPALSVASAQIQADPAEFPAIVQVRRVDTGAFVTTGVVISPRWVLVTASTVDNSLTLEILSSSDASLIPVTDKQFAIAPYAYDPLNIPATGNLALLGLGWPTAALPANLPDPPFDNYAGTTGNAVWHDQSCLTLMKENQTPVTNAALQTVLTSLTITPELMGVLGPPGPTNPQSYGTFFVPGYVVAGMHSFFSGTTGPAVYTRVSEHMPWIDAATASDPPNEIPSPWQAIQACDPGTGMKQVSVAGTDFKTPILTGSGPMVAGSNNQLALTNALPNAPLVLLASIQNMCKEKWTGVLVPNFAAGFGWTFFFNVDSCGNKAFSFNLPTDFPAGVPLWFQYVVIDAGAPVGKALSNAVQAN